MNKCVYIDLDCTIYDFYGAIRKINGYDCHYRMSEHIFSTYNIQMIDYVKLNFNSLVDKGLFDVGPCLGRAEEYLVKVRELCDAHNVELKILGALPYNSSISSKIEESKINWMKKENIYKYFDDIIFVNGSRSKILYGSNDSILIDDYPSTEKSFNLKGYPFILHKNWKDSYTKLTNFLQQ